MRSSLQELTCKLSNSDSFFAINQTLSNIPGDKSISHRAVIIGAISQRQYTFTNFLFSDDCLHTIDIMRLLGVAIELDYDNHIIIIDGKGLYGLIKPAKILDVGNSGTSIRLLTGLLSAQKFASHITGDSSIQNRPMRRIIDPLSQNGASISGRIISGKTDIYPPLHVSRETFPVKPINYLMPIASAQVKSALIFSALYSPLQSIITQPVICRDHTERMLDKFNANITFTKNKIAIIGDQELISDESSIFIPSDISSASFFIALGLIRPNTKLILQKIGINPTRDKIISVLQLMGAKISLINPHREYFEPYADIVVETSQITNISIDPSIIPIIIDEIPVLAIISLFGQGLFRVSNAQELRVKESDRIKSIVNMIKAMGGNIKELADGFEIQGKAQIKDFKIDSFHDHRIAMSAIIGAIASGKRAEIHNYQCIDTSFPNFFDILKQLGINYEFTNNN